MKRSLVGEVRNKYKLQNIHKGLKAEGLEKIHIRCIGRLKIMLNFKCLMNVVDNSKSGMNFIPYAILISFKFNRMQENSWKNVRKLGRFG